MIVDRKQLMEDGFIILRDVIPSEQLDDIRRGFETLVEKQKAIWAQGDPNEWETGVQPRVSGYQRLIDVETANTVELWLQGTSLGVSRQLLSVPEQTAVCGMMLMCSPQQDHGPSNWHRDIHPIDMAPMAVLQADLIENGPKYLQWNIALYDDNVLWTVPGNHRRLNTEEENRQLLEDPRVPLPGSIPVELKAGDGVVYVNYLLHWGSNYSSRLRRTIHGGHAIFSFYPEQSFTEHLGKDAAGHFADWHDRSSQMQDRTEAALRAVMEGDAGAYKTAVEALQPGAGEAGKLVLAIYLSKTAYHTYVLKHPELSGKNRWRADHPHPITINWGPGFADRFTDVETERLWRRFGVLDDRLRADEELFVPGYQSGAMHHYFEEIEPGFGTEEFIDSWAGQTG